MKAFYLACCAMMVGVGSATPAQQANPAQPSFSDYVKSQQLVKLPDGRRIHLLCMGKGSPTVVLTAGLSDWSVSWQPVQKEIAKTTRTCAWDRPAFGHSDPSPLPQDVAHTTSDLEAALKAARIGQPYVLVGHSRGSYETQLFAFRNPKAVAGIVLVDPSAPHHTRRLTMASPKTQALLDERAKASQASVRTCIERSQTEKFAPGTALWNMCVPKPPENYPADLAAFLAKPSSSTAHMKTALSLRTSWETSSAQLDAARRPLGKMPLIVLSADRTPVPVPEEFKSEAEPRLNEYLKMHRELSQLSAAGVHRIVPNSGHYIHHDHPEVVIRTINEVVSAARGRSRR